MKRPKMYLGLVHGPVRNKRELEVTTSVTNLDIHDIARSCRTFGFEQYFIVTPLKAQHEMIGRILGHWEQDHSNDYNPDRHDALSYVKLVDSMEHAAKNIKDITGIDPLIVVTGANFESHDGGMEKIIHTAVIDKRPILLLFGTGWGLLAKTVEDADYRLEPIFGTSKDGYNHLSVRSAVAIYLERYAKALCSLGIS